MRAGALRHRITLQVANVPQNGFGEELPGWVDVATVWGQVEPLKGGEHVEQQRVEAELTHSIRMRYRAGVTPDMRVVYETRVFTIEAPPINLEERYRELVLMCRELVR